MPGFLTPCGIAQIEHEVKKSRFIARASGVSSREDAMVFLSDVKTDFSDARHHCWAYLLGDPKSAVSAAMNDAGEPSGTAGRPILNVLEHKAVGNVMVIVVRYFGGIKLGAGGLVRAYSASAQKVMEELPIKMMVTQKLYTLVFDFRDEQPVRYLLKSLKGELKSIQYSEHVTMIVAIPESSDVEFNDFVSAKKIKISKINT